MVQAVLDLNFLIVPSHFTFLVKIKTEIRHNLVFTHCLIIYLTNNIKIIMKIWLDMTTIGVLVSYFHRQSGFIASYSYFTTTKTSIIMSTACSFSDKKALRQCNYYLTIYISGNQTKQNEVFQSNPVNIWMRLKLFESRFNNLKKAYTRHQGICWQELFCFIIIVSKQWSLISIAYIKSSAFSSKCKLYFFHFQSLI